MTSALDREVQSSYHLILQASDGLYTTLTCLQIIVDDVNDETPMFVAPWFSFQLVETMTSGMHVGQLGARDEDAGENGTIVYSLQSYWAQDTFAIDPYTGIIILIGSLSYEQVR